MPACRSAAERIPNHHEMIGYQADMGDGWWARSTTNRAATKCCPPDKDEVDKVLKRDDWNEYRIRCEGRRIQLWINGQQTVDYTEPDEKIQQKRHDRRANPRRPAQ